MAPILVRRSRPSARSAPKPRCRSRGAGVLSPENLEDRGHIVHLATTWSSEAVAGCPNGLVGPARDRAYLSHGFALPARYRNVASQPVPNRHDAHRLRIGPCSGGYRWKKHEYPRQHDVARRRRARLCSANGVDTRRFAVWWDDQCEPRTWLYPGGSARYSFLLAILAVLLSGFYQLIASRELTGSPSWTCLTITPLTASIASYDIIIAFPRIVSSRIYMPLIFYRIPARTALLDLLDLLNLLSVRLHTGYVIERPHLVKR